MRSGIVHHKSDRKSCVIPTADRNKTYVKTKTNLHMYSGVASQITLYGQPPLQCVQTYA